MSKGCDPANLLYYYDIEAADNKITGKLQLEPLFDQFDAKYDVSLISLLIHPIYSLCYSLSSMTAPKRSF